MNRTNYNLRLGELNTCANQCCTIANEYSSAMTEALFVTIITLVQSLADSLNDALKRGRIMSNLDALDRRRGKAFTLLRNMVINFTCYPVSQQHIVNAARRVMGVLNRYRSIRRQNYSEQSAWIDSLLNDLREDSVAADLALLPGIEVAIEELTDAETTFAAARIDYHKRFRDRGLSASELKRTLLRAINRQLVPFLNAMAVTDYQTWGELAARISDVIDEHNETVRRRKAECNKVETEFDVETQADATAGTQPDTQCIETSDKPRDIEPCIAAPACPIPSQAIIKSTSSPLVGRQQCKVRGEQACLLVRTAACYRENNLPMDSGTRQYIAAPVSPIPSEEQDKSSSSPLVGDLPMMSGTRQYIAAPVCPIPSPATIKCSSSPHVGR